MAAACEPTCLPLGKVYGIRLLVEKSLEVGEIALGCSPGSGRKRGRTCSC